MTPPADLDALVGHVLMRLAAADGDADAPWRTPMLATITADGAPTLRTVVMRSIDPAGRSLRINTDRRSDKVEQLARRPRVELAFWDRAAREQLRVAGTANVATSGDAVASAWASLAPEGRKVYRAADAPGTPVAGPDAFVEDGDEAGRDALAVVTVLWQRWDWLWLGPDGHRRARFHWSAHGRRQAAWVVP